MSAKAAAPETAQGDENGGGSTSNDLIINEGFPALNNFRLPKPGEKPNEICQDPVPRYPFASFSSALSFDKDQFENTIHDCDLAFTARAKEDSDAYSSGATFFIPASIEPRCALEQLALNIFQTHTKGLEPGKHFDMERSGAEWWTLVLDTNSSATEKEEKPKSDADADADDDDDSESSEEEEDDEVGMHFDADYGLEQQLPNYMLHPRIATVTYLSNVGVPTLVLNKRSPPPTDVEKKSLNGSVEQGWLSCPMIGKHIAFDGRLLHGAPGTFFPASNSTKGKGADDEDERPNKKRKLDVAVAVADIIHATSTSNGNSTKRITFMVNIWLNHCPIDAELIDDDLCSQMKAKWEKNEKLENGARLKGDSDADCTPALTWSLSDANKSNEFGKEQVKVVENESDWAGREECVICNREVNMKYCSTMADLHNATKKAHDAEGKSLEIIFEPNVLQLEVGDEVSDSDDDNDDEEE